MYCTQQDIISSQPKLAESEIDIVYSHVIGEATEIVRDDISSFTDIVEIEIGEVPISVKRLAVLKSRELAYRQYYAGKVPENSEIGYNQEQYNERLEQLRQDARAGRVNSVLEPAGKSERFSFFA